MMMMGGGKQTPVTHDKSASFAPTDEARAAKAASHKHAEGRHKVFI